MRLKRYYSLLTFPLIILMVSMACSLPGSDPNAVALTVAAELTKVAPTVPPQVIVITQLVDGEDSPFPTPVTSLSDGSTVEQQDDGGAVESDGGVVESDGGVVESDGGSDGGSDDSDEGLMGEDPPPAVVQQPDLIISDISLTPASPVPDQNTTVKVSVYNQGTAVASQFTVNWWGLNTFSSPSCSWDVMDTLSPHGGRVYTCTFQYASPYPGERYTKAQVDVTNHVTESNEGNNVYQEQVTIAEAVVNQPDLIISDISLTPASPVPDQNTTVKVTVYNQGTAVASQFTVYWWGLDTFSSPSCTWDVNDTISAHGGRVYTCTFQYASPYPGTRYTQAKVDVTNHVTESNEGNNTYKKQVTIAAEEAATQPDLIVSDISLTPATPDHDSNTTVKVSVYNQGTAVASQFVLRWWGLNTFSSPSCTWDINDTISPHGGRVYSCTYKYPSPYPGTRYTKAQVDVTNHVSESNEGNNVYQKQITVN